MRCEKGADIVDPFADYVAAMNQYEHYKEQFALRVKVLNKLTETKPGETVCLNFNEVDALMNYIRERNFRDVY